jgi:nucleoid DNA-binding protein
VTGPAAPVTRRELVDRLRRRLGLSAREANELLDGFLTALTDQLAQGGTVSLSGLGRLETRLTPARPGRTPKTGREVIIPARRRPVFTLSRTLRTMLRETHEEDQDR